MLARHQDLKSGKKPEAKNVTIFYSAQIKFRMYNLAPMSDDKRAIHTETRDNKYYLNEKIKDMQT